MTDSHFPPRRASARIAAHDRFGGPPAGAGRKNGDSHQLRSGPTITEFGACPHFPPASSAERQTGGQSLRKDSARKSVSTAFRTLYLRAFSRKTIPAQCLKARRGMHLRRAPGQVLAPAGRLAPGFKGRHEGAKARRRNGPSPVWPNPAPGEGRGKLVKSVTVTIFPPHDLAPSGSSPGRGEGDQIRRR